MKPEGSLPFSRQPATRPYSEPDETSLHPPLTFWLGFTLILPPIYAYVFQVIYCLQGFPSKSYKNFYSVSLSMYKVLCEFITVRNF